MSIDVSEGPASSIIVAGTLQQAWNSHQKRRYKAI